MPARPNITEAQSKRILRAVLNERKQVKVVAAEEQVCMTTVWKMLKVAGYRLQYVSDTELHALRFVRKLLP